MVRFYHGKKQLIGFISSKMDLESIDFDEIPTLQLNETCKTPVSLEYSFGNDEVKIRAGKFIIMNNLLTSLKTTNDEPEIASLMCYEEIKSITSTKKVQNEVYHNPFKRTTEGEVQCVRCSVHYGVNKIPKKRGRPKKFCMKLRKRRKCKI
jgi:hypothetical protein